VLSPMAKSPWYPDFAPDLYPEEFGFYIAIGGLITTAGAAEAHLSTMILRLMGDDKGYNPLVYPALSGMAFKAKLGVLRALLNLRFEPDFHKIFKDTLEIIQNEFEVRNRIAHAYVGRGRHPGEVYIRETKMKGGNLPEPAYWPLDKLWRASHLIQEGCNLIDRALDRHGVTLVHGSEKETDE
jgi:hypothetical protein